MERSAVVESVHPPWFSLASEAPGEVSTLTFVSDQAEKVAEISIECCEIYLYLNDLLNKHFISNQLYLLCVTLPNVSDSCRATFR